MLRGGSCAIRWERGLRHAPSPSHASAAYVAGRVYAHTASTNESSFVHLAGARRITLLGPRVRRSARRLAGPPPAGQESWFALVTYWTAGQQDGQWVPSQSASWQGLFRQAWLFHRAASRSLPTGDTARSGRNEPKVNRSSYSPSCSDTSEPLPEYPFGHFAEVERPPQGSSESRLQCAPAGRGLHRTDALVSA